MGSGFGGEVAAYYAKFRRGYPPAVIDHLASTFRWSGDDVVVDLGCGTGQLALPIAPRVRAVAGVDPEPDMLAMARAAAAQRPVANAAWLLGTDADLPAIGALLGAPVAAVTIGTAVHWMDRETLFRAAKPLLRPGGGIAVVTNGTPLWLQDADWSRLLRECLERWRGRPLTWACGTDAEGRRRNREALTEAGYRVREAAVEYTGELDVEQIIGGVYSALSVDQLPPPHLRTVLADRIRRALRPCPRIVEEVNVTMVVGLV
jgi:SAM-dependent methyltransferase